ncbi:MAG: cell division protein FtsB [Crocinitomix sp.]|jgi:cell division protein FtsB
MKKIITLLVALMAFGAIAQVSVDEKKVNVNGTKDGFYVSIPYGTAKQIEKELKDELKDWKGKYKNGTTIFVDDCKLKDMGKNTFDVYAKIEANPDGGAFVSVAIDLGGAFLSSAGDGAKAKFIQVRLQKFGIKAAKSVVDEEIKAEEKVLKERQKELEDLEKEEEKMKKAIEDYKKKIEETEQAIEEGKKSQGDKTGEIKEQEEKVKAVVEKKEAVK